MRLENKIAIVTGCGSGIGAATTQLFAKEGAKVIGVDVDQERGQAIIEAIVRNGGEAIFLATDVTKENDVKELVDVTVQKFGKLDIVCNIAGVITLGKVTTLTEDDWDHCMAVNVKGCFLICKHSVPVMAKAGGGAIVNVASGAGLVGTPNSAVYCASKAAVIGLSRAMALDHAKEKIRVNAICPGVTDTPANARIEALTGNPTEARRATEQVIPWGRLASPNEIARCILWLASDEASYVTGSILVADGGYTAQ